MLHLLFNSDIPESLLKKKKKKNQKMTLSETLLKIKSQVDSLLSKTKKGLGKV